MHVYVTRLQVSGPQLVAALKKLVQGVQTDPVPDLQRLLDELPCRGNKGAFGQHSFGATSPEDSKCRLQNLFSAVPCIEEALERLGTLVCLVDRSKAAGAG